MTEKIVPYFEKNPRKGKTKEAIRHMLQRKRRRKENFS